MYRPSLSPYSTRTLSPAFSFAAARRSSDAVVPQRGGRAGVGDHAGGTLVARRLLAAVVGELPRAGSGARRLLAAGAARGERRGGGESARPDQESTPAEPGSALKHGHES